jgi:hypothetical protein
MPFPNYRPGKGGSPFRLNMTEVNDQLLAEFAGCKLTAVDKTLLEHAARCLSKAARSKNPDSQCKLINTGTKIIDQLRRAKATRDPAMSDVARWQEHLAKLSGAKPKAKAGAEAAEAAEEGERTAS